MAARKMTSGAMIARIRRAIAVQRKKWKQCARDQYDNTVLEAGEGGVINRGCYDNGLDGEHANVADNFNDHQIALGAYHSEHKLQDVKILDSEKH